MSEKSWCLILSIISLRLAFFEKSQLKRFKKLVCSNVVMRFVGLGTYSIQSLRASTSSIVNVFEPLVNVLFK